MNQPLLKLGFKYSTEKHIHKIKYVFLSKIYAWEYEFRKYTYSVHLDFR